MRHTPGPWHYVTGAVWTTPGGPDDGGQCVATRASSSLIDPCTRDANLRLCSVAPELLAALQGLYEHCAMIHKQWGEGSNAEQANAAIVAGLAAINKATQTEVTG